MISLRVVLMILALVTFVLAAIGVETSRINRVNLVALGLALWVLAVILT